ASNQDFMRF
uniref:FMRFamide-4 n=1 Tax=Sarcophaga bullata TaxID=7385 RepID=FAR4_SARBU|nr:RecName: Full=FMRFamide-4; AltName: Full=SabFMRFamide-4 [Sarcophaga bullata]